MNRLRQTPPLLEDHTGSHSELLLLPDGRILVHNLTPAFAILLRELNPDCDQITSRISHPESRTDEFSD